MLRPVAQQHGGGALTETELQLPRRVERHDRARRQEGDPVAQLVRLLHEMRGEKDGGAGARVVADDAAHVASRGRVEPLGRFIEKQDAGIVHQRSGDEQPLLHAARVGPDPAGGGVHQAHALEKLRHTCRWRPVELGEQLQVLAARLALVEVLLFEHQVYERLHLLALARDVVAGDARVAARRAGAPRQHADGRRLAGAVVAEQAQDLAFSHAEADLIDRTHFAVVLREVVHLDDRSADAMSAHIHSDLTRSTPLAGYPTGGHDGPGPLRDRRLSSIGWRGRPPMQMNTRSGDGAWRQQRQGGP